MHYAALNTQVRNTQKKLMLNIVKLHLTNIYTNVAEMSNGKYKAHTNFI